MFYDVFSELCERRGISCKRAAMEIGLSNSIAAKWKRTGGTPNGETLNKIASYFNVSVGYLSGKDAEKAPTETGKRTERNDVLDDIDIAFYGEFNALSDDQKATIRDMVSVMRKRRAQSNK